jgi:hypothetical protein
LGPLPLIPTGLGIITWLLTNDEDIDQVADPTLRKGRSCGQPKIRKVVF